MSTKRSALARCSPSLLLAAMLGCGNSSPADPVPTPGVTTQSCANGAACTCSGGVCDVQCASGGTCSVACSGAATCGVIGCRDATACAVDCSGAANCNYIDCR